MADTLTLTLSLKGEGTILSTPQDVIEKVVQKIEVWITEGKEGKPVNAARQLRILHKISFSKFLQKLQTDKNLTS